jgi:hypothetical protein
VTRIFCPRSAVEEWIGRIHVGVTVENVLQPEHALRFDALVDTGAYGLTLPAPWKVPYLDLKIAAA